MKIAVKLNEDKSVQFVNNTSEEAALNQSKDKGWTLVDSDPTFSIDNKYSWTVRKSDKKLVHISTGLTPDEETKALLSELTKSQLKGQLMADQVQQAITSVTKQAIQDKLTSQTAITELTKQVADLTVKLDKANGVDSAPEAPADVTSTATTSGANVTAK